MALDRIIRFDGPGPSKEHLHLVVQDFFGEGATSSISWHMDRLFVSLNGSCSFPFRRLPGAPQNPFIPGDERWIEIWTEGSVVDVITRQADPFTNALAQGLAEQVARHWGGVFER